MDLSDFVEDLNENQRTIMRLLDAEIFRLPGIALKKRYHLPFYYGLSWICYLNPLKSGGIELCFTRGKFLQNPHGLLESRGRKLILGMSVFRLEEIDFESLRDTLHEAYILDREWKIAKRKS